MQKISVNSMGSFKSLFYSVVKMIGDNEKTDKDDKFLKGLSSKFKLFN